MPITRRLFIGISVLFILLIVGIGLTRLINPEFNFAEAVGLADEVKAQTPTQPYWNELTQKQKDALEHLEPLWDSFSVIRKKKWLEIANRMQRLSPEARERIKDRIEAWVNLPPEERHEARENYQSAQKFKDKSSQWELYQNLSDEEKKELAARRRRMRLRKEKEKVEEKPVVVLTPVKEVKPKEKEEEPEYWR